MKSTLRKNGRKVGADALVLLKQSESTEYVVIPNGPDAAYMTHVTPDKKMILMFLAIRYKRGPG